jgi:hypothetical protein
MPRRQRHLGYRLATAGVVFIGLLTLFPHASEAGRVAATPLTCLVCGDLGGVDFVLNILLFIPLGVGLALAGFSWRRALVLAALLSCGIELLQMKVIAGRDASLGDILSNTTGGGIGALLAAYWRRVIFPPPVPARLLALAWALCLTCIWAGSAWAFGPTWPVGAPWYGQWAQDLGTFKPFLGKILTLTAGGEPLLPGRAIDQARLEDAVAANPGMAFRAVLGPRPTGLSPVGAIYDDWQRQVMLLGQDRQDLAFRLRMRASLLKLRAPTVNLRNGMAGQPGDTVEAQGELRDGAIEMSSRIGDKIRMRSLPLSASWGWSLVTPWDSVLGEEVHTLTALWIIGLIGLLAYWSALAGGGAVSIVPVTTVLLLGAIPYSAGFPPAHWSEWAAALIGAGLGAVAANAARRAIERAELSG